MERGIRWLLFCRVVQRTWHASWNIGITGQDVATISLLASAQNTVEGIAPSAMCSAMNLSNVKPNALILTDNTYRVALETRQLFCLYLRPRCKGSCLVDSICSLILIRELERPHLEQTHSRCSPGFQLAVSFSIYPPGFSEALML